MAMETLSSYSKLPASFYLRDDVCVISKELIGKVLCTFIEGKLSSGIIIETEAYAGPIDKASHAYQNKRTKRTNTMFLNGGIAYVYLIYGMHHLFNVVSNIEEEAHAVLVRAVYPLDGIVHMEERRGKAIGKNFSAGPGTLSQALGIKTSHDGIDLLGDTVWLEDRGIKVEEHEIQSRPRIGVDYAEEHALWEWNYFVSNELIESRIKAQNEGFDIEENNC